MSGPVVKGSPGPPGFISVQNADGVTVAFVDAEDKQVRTSTTVEATNGDAIPAVDAEKKARLNTLWGVSAATLAMEAMADAEKTAGGTVYVVDDDGDARQVGGGPR